MGPHDDISDRIRGGETKSDHIMPVAPPGCFALALLPSPYAIAVFLDFLDSYQ